MVLFASGSPDITEGLPAEVSARTQASQTFASSDIRFDVAIAGVPFLSAISNARPYIRQSAPLTKQQLDTSKEAGEQTLDQFWTRSETSWHRGQGVRFYDPGTDDATTFRYEKSMGVNVWTKDQATMLYRMDSIATVSAGNAAYTATGRLNNGSDSFFTLENGTLKRRTDTTVQAYSNPVSGAPSTKMAVNGTSVFVGTATALAAGSSSGSGLADLWTGAPSSPTPYWVKSRLIAATNNSLWELSPAGGVWPATGNELYVHPDPSWTWTSICDAPGAILAAGYGGGYGAIFKFVLQDATSGQTPKLSQAYQIAEFPPGEEVHAIRVYLGSYIGIGTSKGLRVGEVQSQSPFPSVTGNVNYGPLLIQTTNPVRALNARDTFIYAGIEGDLDGYSGVARVNLAEEIPNQAMRFPWAWDAQTHNVGRVDSVSFLGGTDRVVIGVRGVGVYLQSNQYYEPTGYMTSGRVRYATVEPKEFRLLDVGCDTTQGSLGVSTIDPFGAEKPQLTIASGGSGAGISIVQNDPSEYMQVKLTFNASATDNSGTPILNSWRMKALPAPANRQMLIQYPLMCFDFEQSATGVRFGREGYSFSRLQALEAAEQSRAT
ncbi:MAG: hypothetical protein ACXVXW_01900, partial [Mycobacteriaceae bacterium]